MKKHQVNAQVQCQHQRDNQTRLAWIDQLGMVGTNNALPHVNSAWPNRHYEVSFVHSQFSITKKRIKPHSHAMFEIGANLTFLWGLHIFMWLMGVPC